MLEYFIKRPELLAQAKAASLESDTRKIDGMVWEALRFVPISPYMFRQASQDYTVAKGTDHETTIKAGTNVLTLTQSAMFDAYAYEDAEGDTLFKEILLADNHTPETEMLREVFWEELFSAFSEILSEIFIIYDLIYA